MFFLSRGDCNFVPQTKDDMENPDDVESAIVMVNKNRISLITVV